MTENGCKSALICNRDHSRDEPLENSDIGVKPGDRFLPRSGSHRTDRERYGTRIFHDHADLRAQQRDQFLGAFHAGTPRLSGPGSPYPAFRIFHSTSLSNRALLSGVNRARQIVSACPDRSDRRGFGWWEAITRSRQGEPPDDKQNLNQETITKEPSHAR